MNKIAEKTEEILVIKESEKEFKLLGDKKMYYAK